MQLLSLTLTFYVAFLDCLSAKGQSEGDLRLVSNTEPTGGPSGRLEIYHDFQWGTVCDDLFGPTDADVACRQLGYTGYFNYGSVGALGYFPASPLTPTWLDDVSCSGTESRLASCSRNGYGIESCDHSEDIALICSNSTDRKSLDEGSLRLVSKIGLSGGFSGRLEILHNFVWGTVCDDSFDYTDAVVACRQLGYASVSLYGSVGTLGYSAASSTTPTWLDEVSCIGDESRLASCSHAGYGNENCAHSGDIALVCTNSTNSKVEGELRLVSNIGSTGGSSGRLEINHNLVWGTVCFYDNSFSSKSALVACRQLGYVTVSQYGSVTSMGFLEASSSTPVWLNDVSCSGNESRLASCNHSEFGTVNHHCSSYHNQDVALVCINSTSIDSEGDIRLVSSNGSSGGSSGRLEIHHNYQWRTVCSDLFNYAAAIVACRQLGYTSVSAYGTVDTLGYSRATISTGLYSVSCSGTESRLELCSYNDWRGCSYYYEIALICTNTTYSKSEGEIRLVSNRTGSPGSYSLSGRLEIYHGSQWGTVCADSFGYTDASVACRQLGFTAPYSHGRISRDWLYPQASSSTPIWLDHVSCLGTESRLVFCKHSRYGDSNCDHSQDVVLTCHNPTSFTATSSTWYIHEIQDHRITTASSYIVGVSVGTTVGGLIIIVVVVLCLVCCACCSRKRSGSTFKYFRMTRTPKTSSVVRCTRATAYPTEEEYTVTITSQQPPTTDNPTQPERSNEPTSPDVSPGASPISNEELPSNSQPTNPSPTADLHA